MQFFSENSGVAVKGCVRFFQTNSVIRISRAVVDDKLSGNILMFMYNLTYAHIVYLVYMTGIAHTELKEVNKCHFLTTKGP